MNLNQQICQLYERMDPLFTAFQNSGEYSDVFVTGVSEFASRKPKKMLVVGQEARAWRWDEDKKISHEERQRYAVNYLNANLGLCEGENLPAVNASAFWEMMRFIYSETEFFPIWANLDKIHAYRNGVTVPLQTFEEEKRLLARCFDGETLLQKEIELIQPDAVLFVTGPTYYKATKFALGVEVYGKRGSISKEDVPCWNGNRPIQRIHGSSDIPILWTYHPNYAKRTTRMEDYLRLIRDISVEND